MPAKRVAKGGTDGQIPVAEYLRGYDPHVRTLFREVLKVARAAAGTMDEKAYRGWGLWLTSDRGQVAVSGFRDHVNVRMRAGAKLRDRHGLLEGSGTAYRHVKVRSVADARSEGLRDLIRQELSSGPRRLTLREGKGERILERMRKVCFALPDVSERLSHGTPTFFARGKQFVQVWAGHHEDHGLQLWCAAPSGAQPALVKADPERFFVPPYVGHRGWLGVRLDRGIDWEELARILEDAHGDAVAGLKRS